MLAALAFAAAFASTPQRAAMQSTGASAVARTNEVGNVALVQVLGGTLEDTRFAGAVLVKRFPFGWQSLDLVTDTCHFYFDGISNHDAALLSRGIPVVTYQGPCRPKRVDAGPAAEVAAVRYRMRGPFVPYVIVSGSFAEGGWHGAAVARRSSSEAAGFGGP